MMVIPLQMPGDYLGPFYPDTLDNAKQEKKLLTVRVYVKATGKT
jgi:hypothetical protein